MKVSFYILSADKAQDFLGFICQLTQTALNKSTQPILILIEQEDELLTTLDEALWDQATSFIPHQRLKDDSEDAAARNDDKIMAPVLLGSYMPADFKGVVLNTTPHAINTVMAATSNAQPTRILELIKPDSKSMQEGRYKYKVYQQLGYELTHFNV